MLYLWGSRLRHLSRLLRRYFLSKVRGSGWVDYRFPKPGQTEPSQKWTFVKVVTIDGTPGLVASGFYPE